MTGLNSYLSDDILGSRGLVCTKPQWYDAVCDVFVVFVFLVVS